MIAEDIVSYLKEIEEELQSRYELLAKGIESDPAEADYMLLIIDNPDAIEQISNSKEALASYKNIIGRYRNMNVGVIISAIENAPIPYSAPEVIKGIRDGRHLMYFGDISELKIYDQPRPLETYTRLLQTGCCFEPLKVKRAPQSWCYVEDAECTS